VTALGVGAEAEMFGVKNLKQLGQFTPRRASGSAISIGWPHDGQSNLTSLIW
jgi:hypothetical protein